MMALRNTPGKRLVGNPLGGILRDLDRQTRRTTRRRGGMRPAAAVEGQEAEQGAPLAAVITTGGDGRVRWEYEGRFTARPVLSALPVSGVPIVVTVEEVTAGHAVLQTWVGTARAPYVTLHVTAVADPGRPAASLVR